MPLPDAFIKKMTGLLGPADAEAFLATYQHARSWGLRSNLLKIKPQELQRISGFSLRPIPFCPSGFYFNPDEHPGRHPLHQAGLYYIQEPSALFVAECLAAAPGEKVLDLCAAPGGKSTQIAASMKNRGLLVANELYPKRAKILAENLERIGVRHTLITNETPERLAGFFPAYFDRILVDAPCSGEGMFRKDPQAASYWNLDHVDDCARLQAQILDQAYQMLKPGGILVYSTCAFSPEEDEQTIDRLLTRHPDLAILPITKHNGIDDARPDWTVSENAQLKSAARLWPHHLEGEGHFVCKMQKRAENGAPAAKLKIFPVKPPALGDYRDFEQAALRQKLAGPFYFSGNRLFLLPEHCPDVRGLHILRAGLPLGTQKKNRFEPDHALALAFPSEFFQNRRALDLPDCERYLRGEALPDPGSEKGWAAITFRGYPLGWCKSANHLLKNFYPKGLRRRSPAYSLQAAENGDAADETD